MRCAYCGVMLTWPDDFPVRYEACCAACLPQSSKRVTLRSRIRSLFGHIGSSQEVPRG